MSEQPDPWWPPVWEVHSRIARYAEINLPGQKQAVTVFHHSMRTASGKSIYVYDAPYQGGGEVVALCDDLLELRAALLALAYPESEEPG